jgi:fibronectin-binding autotransporter adhesin
LTGNGTTSTASSTASIYNLSTSLETIDLPLTLSGSRTINAANGEISIADGVTGTSGVNFGVSPSLNSTLPGQTPSNSVVILNSVASYTTGSASTAATQVFSGTLQIGAGGSLPTTDATGSANGWVSLGAAANSTEDEPANAGFLVLGDANTPINQTVSFLRINSNSLAGSAVYGGNSAISTLTIDNLQTSVDAYAGNLGGSGTNQNNLALVIAGGGTVSFSGDNTYSGSTTIQNGTLEAGSSTALPATSALVLGGSGQTGTLDLEGHPVTVGSLSAAGSGSGDTIGNGSTSTTLTTGTLIYAGGATPSTYNGTIVNLVGAGSLGVTALSVETGTLILTNINSYSGNTTLSEISGQGSGTLIFSPGSIGTGEVVLDGGTLEYSANNTQDVSTQTLAMGINGGTVNTNGNNVAFANAIVTSQGGAFIKAGAGTLTFSGANTYSGATDVTGGTLLAGVANALSPNSTVNVTGGMLDVSGSAQSIAGLTVSASGTLNLGIGNALTDTGTASFGGTLNVSGTPSGSVVNLMSYASETGTFASVPTFAGYNLDYTATELELAMSGPASFSWDNAGASAPDDGVTWDTTDNNWNNGTSAATYADGDAVTFNDTNNGHYFVTLNSSVSPGSVNVNSSGNYSMTGTGTIVDTGTFIKTGSSNLTLGVGLTASSMAITGGNVVLAPSTTAGTWTAAHPNSNINITSLTIAAGSVFDITNNHIVIDYGSSDPMSAIYGYLKSGFNNGTWNGTSGIISSTAQTATNGLHYGVGWADGADGVHDVFGITSGEIELKYTLLGDANLDGTVNGSDFSILAANFGLGVTNWDQGNFLYSSSVNGSDFSALAANFGQGDSGAAIFTSADIAALDAFAVANNLPLPAISSVPEPTTVGMLALGAIGLLGKRRRR